MKSSSSFALVLFLTYQEICHVGAMSILSPQSSLVTVLSPVLSPGNVHPRQSRRGFLTTCQGIGLVGTMSVLSPQSSRADVIQVTERCDSGIGAGCDDDSVAPIIKELRKKSGENKDQRDAEDLRRYNMNNFKDFFAAGNPPKSLVMYPSTGKFEAVPDSEVRVQMNKGLIKSGSAGSFQDNYASRIGLYFTEEPAAASDAIPIASPGASL